MPGNKLVLKHSWNAFRNRDPTTEYPIPTNVGGMGYGWRPDQVRLSLGNERSIIASILTRIAIDCATVNIKHARLDDNDRYSEDIDSGLNRCLTLNANKDQTARAFLQDAVMSMLDEGVVAIVPIDTTANPKLGTFDINSMRTGKILEWFPDHVRLRVYDDRVGDSKELVLPKKMVAIVENPLYSVMNEPNSTLRRLIYKLNLLDAIDKQSGSGKLDLILQLPYTVRSDLRKKEAEERRARIESQLQDSKYGIAYTDATEKIVQLNRSVENNLLDQIEYLTSMLYGQLGLTDEIINGTADEKVMLNYNNRTVEPIIASICDAMKWKFLTQTARTQKQSIIYYRDPFKLVPTDNLADIADKFTRNEILSSNEMRVVLGYKPADDPRADELRNKNLRAPGDQLNDAGPKSIQRVNDKKGEKKSK